MIAVIEVFSTKEVLEVGPDIAVEMIINGRARLVELREGKWGTNRQVTDKQGHKVTEVYCRDGMGMLD